MSKFFIKSEGPNNEDVIKGLEWLLSISSDKKYNQAAIVIAAKYTLDGSVLGHVLGEHRVKEFMKSNETTINSLKIKLLKQRDDIFFFDGPLLVIYPAPKLLDKVDAIEDTKEVLMVTAHVDCNYWIDKWNAENLS